MSNAKESVLALLTTRVGQAAAILQGVSLLAGFIGGVLRHDAALLIAALLMFAGSLWLVCFVTYTAKTRTESALLGGQAVVLPRYSLKLRRTSLLGMILIPVAIMGAAATPAIASWRARPRDPEVRIEVAFFF